MPDRIRVVILQKYVAPYRDPLFRALMQRAPIELTVLCYGALERRRRYDSSEVSGYAKVQAFGLWIPAGYERNLELPLGLPAALNRLAPEVVVCAPDWGGIFAARYCKRHGARLVVWSESTHTTEAGLSIAKRTLRHLLYQRAAAFVVPGRLAKSYIESMGGRSPFFEAPNCIDETAMRISDAALLTKFSGMPPRVIAFSGSLVERKGVGLLHEAFAAACARHPDAATRTRLRIIGTGPMNVSRWMQTNVELTGHLTGDAYRNAMRTSHVFVLPSLWDCNPLVVVEALNCGAVLILSDGVGSYPEALSYNGRLVARGDIECLTDALAWVMTKPEPQLLAMAQYSLAIAAHFDTSRTVDGFLSAIMPSRFDRVDQK